MAKRPLTVVGLGNLGLPLACRYLDRGAIVHVADSNAARVGVAVEHGAYAWSGERPPEGPQALALVVPDDHAVRQVLFDQGFMGRLSPGSALLIHSTIMPATAQELAADCASRAICFVDAPLSGGADRARNGELVAMVGANEDDLAELTELLEMVASTIVHVGPPGAGMAAKLANQLMLFAALHGVYEAMQVAAAYGVSESRVLQAVASGTGASWASQNWGFYDRLAAEYETAGTPAAMRPWHKDMIEMAVAAQQVGLKAPLAEFIAERLPELIHQHARQQDAIEQQENHDHR